MEPTPVILDTNAFLQLRDLKDLPWHELIPGVAGVDLIVTNGVIKELDAQKTGSSRRRRDRARAALALVDAALNTGSFAVELRRQPMTIRLVVSTVGKIEWSNFPQLDPAKVDDQLVAETTMFGSDAVLFSHDRAPVARAKLAGVKAVRPPDHWHLPDEQTEEDRKIARLERELKQAQSQFATIELEVRDDRYELFVPRLPPLSAAALDRAVLRVLDDNPRTTFDQQKPNDVYLIDRPWVGSRAAGKYYSAYDKYREELTTFFATLHQKIIGWSDALALDYAVINNGNQTAAGLRIETSLEGDAVFWGSEKEARKIAGALTLPTAPKPPGGPDKPLSLNIPRLPEEKDPTAFYWVERPRGHYKASSQCAEFRPQRKWEDSLWISVLSGSSSIGTIDFEISARNMASPVKRRVPIRVLERFFDWSDRDFLRTLPEPVRLALS
jgi:hypothetical protein